MCYEDKGEVSGTAGQETRLRLTRAQTEREKPQETAGAFSVACFLLLLSASPHCWGLRPPLSLSLYLLSCNNQQWLPRVSQARLYASSVQFSRSVMSDSLQPHESQHARPPCPSPTPGVHPNSCPSSPCCHPAISSCHFSISHVWMWELDHKEGWAPKNWCFWTVVLEKNLRVPWTARRSNQSMLKEVSPEYSLEGLMLKLKLQYFGHLMQRTDSSEKTLMLGKTEGRRRRRRQRMRWLDGITNSWTWVWASSGSWWWTGRPNMLQSMGSQSRTRLRNWTKLITHLCRVCTASRGPDREKWTRAF